MTRRNSTSMLTLICFAAFLVRSNDSLIPKWGGATATKSQCSPTRDDDNSCRKLESSSKPSAFFRPRRSLVTVLAASSGSDSSDPPPTVFFADKAEDSSGDETKQKQEQAATRLEEMAAQAIKAAEAQLDGTKAQVATETQTTPEAKAETPATSEDETPEPEDETPELDPAEIERQAKLEEENKKQAKLEEQKAFEERIAAEKERQAKLEEEIRLAEEEREKQFMKFKASVGKNAQESYEKYIKPLSEIKEGVSADRIKGAALAATALTLLASKGVIASGAVGLSAAYLSISKTVAGDVLRTVGEVTWDMTASASKVAQQLGIASPKFGAVDKKVVNKYKYGRKPSSTKSRADRIDEVELAYIEAEDDEDLARVLREAESVIEEADAVIAKAEAVKKEKESKAEKEEEEAVEELELVAETEGEEDDVEEVVPEPEEDKEEVKELVPEPEDEEEEISEEEDEVVAAAEEEEDDVEEVVPEPEEDKEEVKELVPEPEDEEEEISEEEEVVAETAEDDVEEVVPEPEEDKEEVKELVSEPEDEEEEIAEEVEEMVAEAEDKEEEDGSNEAKFFDDDEFMAAVELAQEGIEGKIVGVDEIITDNFARAEWDAAGELANELRQDGGITDSPADVEEEDDDDDDDFDFGDLDIEALGKMARQAVETFESDENIAYEAVLNQKREWADSMTEEDVDDVDFEDGGDDEFEDDDDSDDVDFEDDDESFFSAGDLEQIAAAARAAVEESYTDDVPKYDSAPTTDIVEKVDWSSFKVVALKSELKTRGLKATGKKADLVKLLEENDLELSGQNDEEDRTILDADSGGGNGGDDDLDLEDFDIEELGRQARAAVEMFQTTGGDFDEEPTEEMLAQLESEMAINGDFLVEPQKDAVDISIMTVVQLKDECRKRGLKVGGKKADLVERLQASPAE